MKLNLTDGGHIFVNPAHVVAIEPPPPTEDSGTCTVILSANVLDEDGAPGPLTAEVKASAEETAKQLGLA